jgi:predicted ATPase
MGRLYFACTADYNTPSSRDYRVLLLAPSVVYKAMNEQLIVKNFGPFGDKGVEVTFKKITILIGPTGGGKSTLAKLVAIVKQKHLLQFDSSDAMDSMSEYGLSNYFHGDKAHIKWRDANGLGFDLGASDIDSKNNSLDINQLLIEDYEKNYDEYKEEVSKALNDFLSESKHPKAHKPIISNIKNDIDSIIKKYVIEKYQSIMFSSAPHYIPAERLFLSAIGESWAGIIRDDIGLPKILVNFANQYSTARKNINTLYIQFLSIQYSYNEGKELIKLQANEEFLPLYEAASGIQSVTPLLVLLEHLSRTNEHAQSFIIEEPELNLFPTAQFELVKTLVDKCARIDGQNDLVLTTHSPYVLTALNLMCYAFRIAQQDEATAKKVAKLIPRNCWIDPEQFAAYYVDRPDTKRKEQVRSIINKKTGLIEENELDTASDELGDIFDKLVRLRKPAPTTARAK